VGSGQAVREVVVIDPVDLEEIRETARRAGARLAEVPPFRGIETVMTSLLLVGDAMAVGRVQEEVERRRGGLVFDLRVGAMRPIHRSRAVAYGELAVYAVDGVARIERCGGELIAALTKLASSRGEKTVAMVKETAASRVR